jgi:pimeloyl-ACP methyl ester carboxylesterase
VSNVKCRLYLIDGTGPENWNEYVRDMSRGFCLTLKNQNKELVEYLRGPTTSGLTTWMIGDAMLAFIRADRAKHPNMRILLGGHSRGGAAVIHVARKLKEEKITVHGLVLFDAVRRAIQKSPAEYANQIVTRSHGVPGLLAVHMASAVLEVGLDAFGANPIDKIPSNVERALHLVRDEKFSNFFLYTPEWKKLYEKGPQSPNDLVYNARIADFVRMHNQMRNACRFNCMEMGVPTGFSFGNTGLLAEPGCHFMTPEKYQATHGAMGGAPLDPHDYIKTDPYASQIEAQEIKSMLAVQTRVNSFLKELGFGSDHAAVSLKYKPMSLPGGKAQLGIK